MMDRRRFVGASTCFLLALPILADAQQPQKVWRIGYLGTTPPTTPEAARIWDAFRQALQDRGYVEERNLLIERRFSGGRDDRYPELANELVRLGVDLIMTVSSPGTRAAKDATSAIPIVMVSGSDPVGRGFVDSLARPGGNITGISDTQVDLIPKRLELLKEAAPKTSRIVSVNYPAGFDAARLAATRSAQAQAAQALGMTLLRVELRAPHEFDKARTEIAGLRPDALLLGPTPANFALRNELAEFAIAHHLPAIAARREEALAGILISYGPSLAETYRNAVAFVDKILKGAKPADLPVEQPTRFELVINLKTAKALGITIPQSVLLRADEVIQ